LPGEVNRATQSISVAITLLKSGPISGILSKSFFLFAVALLNLSIQFFNLLLQQLCHLQILLQQRLISAVAPLRAESLSE